MISPKKRIKPWNPTVSVGWIESRDVYAATCPGKGCGKQITGRYVADVRHRMEAHGRAVNHGWKRIKWRGYR